MGDRGLAARKGLVHEGHESPVSLECRMEERMAEDEAGEVGKGQTEKGLDAL